MFRKTMLVVFLVLTLVGMTGCGADVNKNKVASFEKVFTLTPDANNIKIIWALEPFKDHLYATVADKNNGMQLYWTANGNDWEAVGQPGFGLGPTYKVSWDMIEFKGKLYASVHDLGNFSGNIVVPGKIMRSSNGTDWETVWTDSWDKSTDPPRWTGRFIAALGVFKGMLYVTNLSMNPGVKSEIWRSASGDAGTWELANPAWDSYDTTAVTEFKGYAYLGGYLGTNPSFGVSVWRSADGVKWDTVGNNDWKDLLSTRAGLMAVFRNELYFSTASSEGGHIYRTQDGLNWMPVIQPGFGDPTITEIDTLFTYGNDLYAGAVVDPNGNATAKIFRSHTGNLGDWVQIPTDSWGSPSGLERLQQATFNGQLYLVNFYAGSIYKMTYH